MNRIIEQVKDILHGTHRWNAGLQWYDSLLSIEFRRDGTGELRFSSNPFPEGEGHPDPSPLDYYGWAKE